MGHTDVATTVAFLVCDSMNNLYGQLISPSLLLYTQNLDMGALLPVRVGKKNLSFKKKDSLSTD